MEQNPYESPREEGGGINSGRRFSWIPQRQPWRGHVIAVIVGALIGLLLGFGLAMWGLFFPESFPIKED